MQVFIHFFGHAFGQGSYQHTVSLCYPFVNLIQQIIYLVNAGPYLNRRIEQSCGAHDLLHYHTACFFQLVFTGSSRNINRLVEHGFKFMKIQGPVVQRRRKPEAIIHQYKLPAPVPPIHTADLRYGLMAFINYAKKVFGKIIQQAEGPCAGRTAVKEAGIVFHAVAITR